MNNVGNYVFMKLWFHETHCSDSTPIAVNISSLPPSQGFLLPDFSSAHFLKFCLWSPSSHSVFYFRISSTLMASTIASLPVTLKSLPLFFTHLRNIYLVLIATDISIWKSSWCLKLLMSKTQLIFSFSYVDLFHWSLSHPSHRIIQKYRSHPDLSFSLMHNFQSIIKFYSFYLKTILKCVHFSHLATTTLVCVTTSYSDYGTFMLKRLQCHPIAFRVKDSLT